ncbi:hypothetical protein RhiirA5_507399 [Rhizophagus irregularis]|uniref:Uncharacterized protein n=1 Tax=Rhizophagus irregularis TaxID=588596 RepID=A0A2N0NKM1_9GLOM|nr:hypothetical protein RhiirA5_507399 [Rhizophagus irregularis]GET66356.1 hypothetical protein RIR_e17212_A0A2N0NKM1_9GLOM [Rhizophagus irregularis DAOM 181602=DAOM 197198]
MFINVSFSLLCDLFFKLLDVNFDVSFGGSGCGILFFNSFDVRLQWNGSDMVR